LSSRRCTGDSQPGRASVITFVTVGVGTRGSAGLRRSERSRVPAATTPARSSRSSQATASTTRASTSPSSNASQRPLSGPVTARTASAGGVHDAQPGRWAGNSRLSCRLMVGAMHRYIEIVPTMVNSACRLRSRAGDSRSRNPVSTSVWATAATASSGSASPAPTSGDQAPWPLR
jgi:hypothetical protein